MRPPQNGAAPGRDTGGGGFRPKSDTASIARPCPLCGARALYDDRGIVPPGVAAWACSACYFEGSTPELLSEVRAQAAASWADEPAFVREVMAEPAACLAVRRFAVPLLEQGVAPAIVEELARLVNESRARPANEGELRETLLGCARSVARLRLVAA